MIPQVAIDAFLKAPRDDHRWMKELSAKQLDGAIAALKPMPYLNGQLRLHQKVGFLLGVSYPQFAFFYDMGSGKTILALELLRYWWLCGRLHRAIILVKSDKAFPTWEKQISFWGIKLPYLTLGNSSSKEKWARLEGFKAGLIILTYPGLVRMVSEYLPGEKDAEGEEISRGRLKLDPGLIAELMENVQGVVLDESTTCGYHDSLITQACMRMRRKATFFYELAGRPFGRDPTLVWSQLKMLDGGEALGETLGLFRSAFFHEDQNLWSRSEHAKDYTFNRLKMPQLMRLIQHRSLAYAAEECSDVPPFQSFVEEVYLPDEAGAYYKRVVQQIIAAKGNLQEMKNAFVSMRQLSSGFLGFRNEDDGKRVEIAFTENPKLDLLLELLEGLSDDRKAVVFYDFTHSGRQIYNSLKRIGRQGIWIWSGTKDAAYSLRLFQEDPDYTVAVINNRIGAYSLDGLQVANYCFFYESPVSVLDREQAERRLRRQGQKRKVFQYDLVVRGTLDRRILEFHREGDDLLAALRANPKALLKNL